MREGEKNPELNVRFCHSEVPLWFAHIPGAGDQIGLCSPLTVGLGTKFLLKTAAWGPRLGSGLQDRARQSQGCPPSSRGMFPRADGAV